MGVINAYIYISAFILLIHSFLLHSEDMRPLWETWRVKPTVSIECKSSSEHTLAAKCKVQASSCV